MKSKPFIKIFVIILVVICVLLLAAYYYIGINFFTIDKRYNKKEIKEYAAKYSTSKVWFIKKEFFSEYGSGHFPKYKIFNEKGMQLSIHPCYETFEDILNIIKIRIDSTTHLNFTDEYSKLKEIDNREVTAKEVFDSSKYNIIYYYKNAMEIIQLRGISNIPDSAKDSLNFIFVNVDRVDFR
ncbi:MAG: hypothetical protein M9931_11160 [Chitinophagales bacterium]|nr:hypothetical protein [Chitinophagales bacterium]OJV27776.1 MAG: hypothetical protein BGO32_11000 [Bacteroidetes bacterium 37-13]